MTIEDVDEIRQRLEKIGVATAQDHIREAGRGGAEVIQEDASTRVNTGPHRKHLSDSIVVEEIREQDSRISFAIGPDKDHFWGRFVEFGHQQIRVTARIKGANGRTKKRITVNLGQVPPYPFMRPALDTKRRDANQRVAEILRRRLGL